MEFGLNFPIAFTALLENLIIVENIYGRKSFKVSVCGIEELKSNVMHKLGLDLIHKPQLLMRRCLHKLKRCLELCHHLHTHKTPSIRDGQRRFTKLKHKEAQALKERKELGGDIGGA